ncbi:MAG TPA: hypothetical protein VMH88_01345 [Gemmatimonadales bacterium]|nr:hypothetical protein [Gemmatimonadales bacterium]
MNPDRPSAEATFTDPGDYSFVLGGPLYQLLRRAHLTGTDLELARQRILVLTALTWLPLLILSALQGLALGAKVAVPFLRDVEVNARFLLVVPLLIAAEITVHKRLRFVARQFVERELIPAGARRQFEDAITSTIRLRNSIPAELALIAIVYVLGIQVIWRNYTGLDVATWYATPSPEGKSLTLAGYWYVYLSLPFSQFLLLRWYYRLFIWARFLWQVARIELRLVPVHPDRTGGLGFLSLATFAFTPLAAAHGAMVSAWIASRIFQQHAALLDFKVGIVVLVVFMLVLFLGPFFVFTPRLSHTWRQGERDYGPLAERYAHQFDAKWVHTEAPPRDPLLGSNDIQSLADMANVYNVARTMRFTPVTRQAIIQVAVATLAPIAPLALTMMPLAQLVKLLAGMLF